MVADRKSYLVARLSSDGRDYMRVTGVVGLSDEEIGIENSHICGEVVLYLRPKSGPGSDPANDRYLGFVSESFLESSGFVNLGVVKS